VSYASLSLLDKKLLAQIDFLNLYIKRKVKQAHLVKQRARPAYTLTVGNNREIMNIKIVLLLLPIFSCAVNTFSQNTKLVLPTPNSLSINYSDLNLVDKIDTYITSNFNITQPKQILQKDMDSLECHSRTEFGNITLETRTCDFSLDKTLEFKGYSIIEINRIFKILFSDGESHEWYDDHTYGPVEGQAGCFLEIMESNDKILVYYGCSS